MSSPGRISPTISESSSDSPENELEEYTRPGSDEPSSFISQGHSSSGFGSAAPKRRNVFFGGMAARETKSRRKDVRGGGGAMWDQGGAGSSRGQRGDDMVDQGIVDILRVRECLFCCYALGTPSRRARCEVILTPSVEFGDPFDESDLKKGSVGN